MITSTSVPNVVLSGITPGVSVYTCKHGGFLACDLANDEYMSRKALFVLSTLHLLPAFRAKANVAKRIDSGSSAVDASSRPPMQDSTNDCDFVLRSPTSSLSRARSRVRSLHSQHAHSATNPIGSARRRARRRARCAGGVARASNANITRRTRRVPADAAARSAERHAKQSRRGLL